MNKLIATFMFLLLFSATIFGQNKASLDNLNREFQLFNYSKVIQLAEALVTNKEEFSKTELIEIYLLKGISHYSLGDSESVKNSFYKILDIDKN